MRLLRMFITAHYSAFSKEVPDGLTTEGAIISTNVGRVLAAAGIEWLRFKGVTTYRKGFIACLLIVM
jgi:hypothetical protein